MNGFAMATSTLANSTFFESPANGSCASHENITAEQEQASMDILIACLNAPIGLFIIVSSLMILTVIKQTRRLQTPSNLILCSLTVSDFLVGFVCVPVFVAYLVFRTRATDTCLLEVLRGACSFSMYLSSGGSLVQISVFSWDRWQALSQPLMYKAKVTRQRAMFISGACWVGWITWLTIILHGMPLRMREICTAATCCALVLSPVLFHFALCATVRKQFQKIARLPNTYHMVALLQKERRVTITLRYLILAFLVCLFPVVIIWVSYVAGVTTLKRHAFPWAITLTFLNSCLNPIIYFWRIPDMRIAAVCIFRSNCGTCWSVESNGGSDIQLGRKNR